MTAPRVVVLAQDLIWADRLARAVEAAGGQPTRVRTAAELEREVTGTGFAIVDLTAHVYDPLGAITAAAEAGARVIAVGQHDDHETRKRALAAGAERVYAYRKLHEAGPAVITAWIAPPVQAGA